MTLTTKQISDKLSKALMSNPDIPHETMLFKAVDVVEEKYKDELENLIGCYGPDTTVLELVQMAKVESPKPVKFKDILGWLKIW